MVRTDNEHWPVISAGIDWLSVRTRDMDQTNSMDSIAEEVFDRARESGEKVERSARLGYVGRNVTGLFFGHKEAASLITLSGNTALQHGPTLLRVGGSVARLDLQVTIDTGMDRPNLASSGYYQARMHKSKGGRPRELKLTQTHPQGDTLNVGKRTSDSYARLYDYGAAHNSGPAHQLWRYEVEYKRATAKTLAATLAHSLDTQGVASHYIYEWFNSRLPHVYFTPPPASSPLEPLTASKERDVLLWFEQSLSKCIARAMKDYGEVRVLTALGLLRPTDSNTEV